MEKYVIASPTYYRFCCWKKIFYDVGFFDVFCWKNFFYIVGFFKGSLLENFFCILGFFDVFCWKKVYIPGIFRIPRISCSRIPNPGVLIPGLFLIREFLGYFSILSGKYSRF